MKIRKKKRSGFTLIELSIVLIIIGLLLAAIMKGKDLIKNAEIKKFYNNFIKQWEIIYTSYYDRTGKVLGAPLVIKDNNGKYFEYNDFIGGDMADSNYDIVIRDPRRLRMIYPNEVRTDNGWMANQIIAAGLKTPEIVRGYPNIYDLSASELGKTTVIITFGSDPATEDQLVISKYATSVSGNSAKNDGNVVTSSASDLTLNGQGSSRGNLMFIINLPFDVAAQIDKIIDGVADGKKGRFVCVGTYKTPWDIDKASSWNSITNILSNTVTDIDKTADCGGPFGWGNGYGNKYVTAMYRIGL